MKHKNSKVNYQFLNILKYSQVFKNVFASELQNLANFFDKGEINLLARLHKCFNFD